MTRSISPWEAVVRAQFREICGNCGSGAHLRVKMVVPEDLGGKMIPSNGVLLCRVCEIASSKQPSEGTETRRPINFWVSEGLYSRLHGPIGFTSMGAAVRHLMRVYVEDPDRFDDLGNYQDETPATKVSVWVDRDVYATFQTEVGGRGLTVTDACKSLLLFYLSTNLADTSKKEPDHAES